MKIGDIVKHRTTGKIGMCRGYVNPTQIRVATRNMGRDTWNTADVKRVRKPREEGA